MKEAEVKATSSAQLYQMESAYQAHIAEIERRMKFMEEASMQGNAQARLLEAQARQAEEARSQLVANQAQRDFMLR